MFLYNFFRIILEIKKSEYPGGYSDGAARQSKSEPFLLLIVGVFQKNLRGGRGIGNLITGKGGLGNVKFLCQLCLREPDAFAQAPEPFPDDFQGCVTSFSVSSIPGNRECVNDIFT